jgi:hypothetical protein
MILPSSESLKAQFPQENPSHEKRLQNLIPSRQLAYRLVAKANRK